MRVLIGAGIVVMGLSHEAIQVAIGCGISGIGTGLLNPQTNNMLIARAGPGARGRAAGLGYTARYTGDFINPVIVGPLAVAVGLHAAFVIVGAAFVAASAIISSSTVRPRSRHEIFLPSAARAVESPGEFVNYPAVAEMCQAVERAGLDAVYVTDHPAPVDRGSPRADISRWTRSSLCRSRRRRPRR